MQPLARAGDTHSPDDLSRLNLALLHGMAVLVCAIVIEPAQLLPDSSYKGLMQTAHLQSAALKCL